MGNRTLCMPGNGLLCCELNGTQKLPSQTTVSPVPVSGRNGRLRADQAAGAKDQSFLYIRNFTLGL